MKNMSNVTCNYLYLTFLFYKFLAFTHASKLNRAFLLHNRVFPLLHKQRAVNLKSRYRKDWPADSTLMGWWPPGHYRAQVNSEARPAIYRPGQSGLSRCRVWSSDTMYVMLGFRHKHYFSKTMKI